VRQPPSVHPNKYFLQNQMRFPEGGPFVRGVGARRDGGRGNTCFRALRRLTNLKKGTKKSVSCAVHRSICIRPKHSLLTLPMSETRA
jgi:hypothetical protein